MTYAEAKNTAEFPRGCITVVMINAKQTRIGEIQKHRDGTFSVRKYSGPRWSGTSGYQNWASAVDAFA